MMSLGSWKRLSPTHNFISIPLARTHMIRVNELKNKRTFARMVLEP